MLDNLEVICKHGFMIDAQAGLTRQINQAEESLHLIIHFFAVLILFAIVTFLPLWLAIALIALEVWQMKYFGHCFLTKFAHKRGFMKGMTYWQYISYLAGIKDYKKADFYISTTIKLLLAGVLIVRLGYWLVGLV